MTGDVVVGDLRAEYSDGDALGIGVASPRLSWTITTDRPGWMQSAYEVGLGGTELGRVESSESVFVAWPAAPLPSRAERRVRVRVWGTDGSRSAWSDPITIETGLLSSADWTAQWITAPSDDDPGRPR